MSTEKKRSHSTELPLLSQENGLNPLTIIDMLAQLPEGSTILQDGDVRAELLIDLAARLNNLHPRHKDDLRSVSALGPYHIVAATSYNSIREVFRLGLERLFLQSKLAKKIGHVLTSEGQDWKDAANITRRHTRRKPDHEEIAMRDIAKTFDQFKGQLTSEEGMPASTFTVEMIYKIMTDTVFGGYEDKVIASWKDDIVYFLKHLIEVQQAYAVGAYTENLPKAVQRMLMRIVAKMQGASDVLEHMLSIEDKIFPDIRKWIEDQQEKNLTDAQLEKMGILGAVLLANRQGRELDISRADIFGIYTAALDSTANAANWLFAELAQHPEILRKLGSLEGEDRAKYIKFILFELWRKDPITPIIFRQVPAGEGVTLADGTFLPAGTIVLLSVGAAGLDEKRFPNPDVFDPDRYYLMSDDEIVQVEADLDLVFGLDKHKCQGQKAANGSLGAQLEYMANHIESISIVPTEDGEAVVPVSNNSGVCSPVDMRGKGLKLRVKFRAIPKE